MRSLVILAVVVIGLAVSSGSALRLDVLRGHGATGSTTAECDLFVQFVMDVSNSMSVAEKKIVEKDTIQAAADLSAGRKLWYQFSRFASEASRINKKPVLYEAAPFAADVHEALFGKTLKAGDGWTNHGAGLHVASDNIDKAKNNADLKGVKRVVMVITDGETTMWTGMKHPEMEDRKPTSELNTYTRKIKDEQKAVLAVLFIGAPDAKNRAIQQMEQHPNDVSYFQKIIDKYDRLRREMLQRASLVGGEPLSADLGSFEGIGAKIKGMLAKSCMDVTTGDDDDDDEPKCKLRVTVIADISRSVIVGPNAAQNMIDTWNALGDIYTGDTMFRLFGFAGELYPIVPKYASFAEAQAAWSTFKLGITNKYTAGESDADVKDMVARFEQATGVDGAHNAQRQVAFFGVGGKWHFMMDDTRTGRAVLETDKLPADPGLPADAKEVWIVTTDGAPYINSDKVCHDAYIKLAEKDAAIAKASPSMTPLQRHEKLMSESPQMEREASECCIQNADCDLRAAIEAAGKKRPIVMLFAGTTFRSETTIKSVTDANQANHVSGTTVKTGETLDQMPKMLREAAEELEAMHPCNLRAGSTK